jgi:hypothetical protein
MAGRNPAARDRLTELLPEACEMDRVVEELRGVAPDVYRQGGTVQLVSERPRARSVFPAGTLVTLAGSTNLLSTRLGDEWYSFVAGELIPSEHPAVVRNPDNFEPAVGYGQAEVEAARERMELQQELEVRRVRIEQLRLWDELRMRHDRIKELRARTRSTTARAKADDRWTVTLRVNAPPRFTIHLDGETVQQIREEVAVISHDQLETGGYLFARLPADESDVRVIYTTGAGAGSRHGRRIVALAKEADVRRELIPDWLEGPDLLRVGDWHYHPTPRTSQPSKPDVRGWASYLRRNDSAYMFGYPAIIVTPDRPSGPTFHGWVTRRAGADHYVCEPADVRDRMGYCE